MRDLNPEGRERLRNNKPAKESRCGLSPHPYKPKKANMQPNETKKAIRAKIVEELAKLLLKERLPLDIINYETGKCLVPANGKIGMAEIRLVAKQYEQVEINPSPLRNRIRQIFDEAEKAVKKMGDVPQIRDGGREMREH